MFILTDKTEKVLLFEDWATFLPRRPERNSPSFVIKVNGKVLEDVHMRGVGDGGHVRCLTLGLDVGDRLRTNIQDNGIY